MSVYICVYIFEIFNFFVNLFQLKAQVFEIRIRFFLKEQIGRSLHISGRINGIKPCREDRVFTDIENI
jgi:hypothetical protein